MALTVATNVGAIAAKNAASTVNKDMETAMVRLSSGKRINSAADDAAGVAIATRLTSEINGTAQAIRNAADAQAMRVVSGISRVCPVKVGVVVAVYASVGRA